jgi:hypothetical protein
VESPGSVIGSYKLLEQICEGGTACGEIVCQFGNRSIMDCTGGLQRTNE